MPEVAWRNFYRIAEEAGYSLELPNAQDRADFRSGIKERYGLDPRENPIRAVYVIGKDGKHWSNFFGDEEYLDNIKPEIMEMASKASEGRERTGFNNYHYQKTLLEIVADKLMAGQETIEWDIDPHMYDKLVVLFWRKAKQSPNHISANVCDRSARPTIHKI